MRRVKQPRRIFARLNMAEQRPRAAEHGERRNHASRARKRTLLKHGDTIGEAYAVDRLLGSGAFGEVWSLRTPATEDGVGPLCIKWGRQKASDGKKAAHLAYEYTVLKALREHHGGVGHENFPRVVNFVQTLQFDGMVMEKGGLDLRRASVRMTRVHKLLAMGEALCALRAMHEAGWIHRDVKPSNFVMRLADTTGVASPFRLMMVDFGLAKNIGSKKSPPSTPHENGFAPCVVGTVRYASARVLCKMVASMRDDIEGLAYTFLQVFGVALPADDLQDDDASVSASREDVCERKRSLTVAQIVGRGPSCIARLLTTARGLLFDEFPPFRALLDHVHADVSAERQEEAERAARVQNAHDRLFK